MTEEAIVTLSTAGVVPQLHRDDAGNFSLRFGVANYRLAFALDKAQVHALGLSCVHYFPEIDPRYAAVSEEEAYRLPARAINRTDDRSLQILILEIQSDDLAAFLWYMKDEEMAQRVFANMASAAAESLFEDMQSRYGHLNPDTAPQDRIVKARAATLTILDTFGRLANAGQICAY